MENSPGGRIEYKEQDSHVMTSDFSTTVEIGSSGIAVPSTF